MPDSVIYDVATKEIEGGITAPYVEWVYLYRLTPMNW